MPKQKMYDKLGRYSGEWDKENARENENKEMRILLLELENKRLIKSIEKEHKEELGRLR